MSEILNNIKTNQPAWLAWAREIFSLSQAGLTYCKNEFDLERYRRLQEIAAEIIASQSEIAKEAVLGSFSMQAGYTTPKIDVRGAVVRDGKILLVQERIDDRWSIPGGWADLGEVPSEMVIREVREESGFEVRADKLIAVYDANRIAPMEFYHAYKLIFLCTIIGGEAQTSIETLGVDFFAPDALPPLSEFRTNRTMIAEVFAHLAAPNRPTYFE
jgi:ADP-ribose pyrophosphatase YjhB (NUDIX family)